ncbi:MAG TPA: hypothetical protein VNW92_13655 [Polyangiaceae bacterium]|nr:hypothetical protein [Polyangiaceae bacterium]
MTIHQGSVTGLATCGAIRVGSRLCPVRALTAEPLAADIARGAERNRGFRADRVARSRRDAEGCGALCDGL